MGGRCTVCSHPDREAIDDALVRGSLTYRELTARYGLSKDSLSRHRATHVSAALAAILAADNRLDEGQSVPLLRRVENLIARTDKMLKAAEREGRVNAALAAVRELRALLELLGKASGELREGPQVTVNLLASPEWLAIRDGLFAALSPFPDARAAVAGRLLQIETGDDPGEVVEVQAVEGEA
jgi:hypothetical protein